MKKKRKVSMMKKKIVMSQTNKIKVKDVVMVMVSLRSREYLESSRKQYKRRFKLKTMIQRLKRFLYNKVVQLVHSSISLECFFHVSLPT